MYDGLTVSGSVGVGPGEQLTHGAPSPISHQDLIIPAFATVPAAEQFLLDVVFFGLTRLTADGLRSSWNVG